MSDANLRALERLWRESGTVEAEAMWLAARSRTSTLARERLELAAYCGHAAARLAVGEEEACARAARAAMAVTVIRVVLGEPLRNPDDLHLWLRGLAAWGDEACTRALLATLDVALVTYEPHFGEGPWVAAEPARAWLQEGRTPDAAERQRALSRTDEIAGVEVGEDVEDALHQTTWSLARVLLAGRFDRNVLAAVGKSLITTSLEPEAVRRGACAALVEWVLSPNA